MINLYALRASRPQTLTGHADPEGPDNPKYWQVVLADFRLSKVVAAWGDGAIGRLPRSRALTRQIRRSGWLCFGHTNNGQPRHPL